LREKEIPNPGNRLITLKPYHVSLLKIPKCGLIFEGIENWAIFKKVYDKYF